MSVMPRVCMLMLTTEARLQDGTAQWARSACREQSRHYPNVNRHSAIVPNLSIGDARNELLNSISKLRNPPDIIIHWDDDDWSAPRRVKDQVQTLLESRAQAVGYNEMLFCDTSVVRFDESFGDGGFGKVTETEDSIEIECGPLVRKPQAWRYLAPFSHYMLGTSMCYWLETWRRHPFASGNAGCDDLHWSNDSRIQKRSTSALDALGMPLMVATVHAGNTACRIDPGATEWERVPQYDGLVEGIFGVPPADWPRERQEAAQTFGLQRQR